VMACQTCGAPVVEAHDVMRDVVELS
jgi:hypothetical protein